MTAFEWATAKTPSEPPAEFYCQTRDVAQARVEKIRILLEKQGWREEDAVSITAIAGELANNSFDHNLGTWKDLPGCWLEVAITSDGCTIQVADRGQGILNSLRRVRPGLKNHHEALLLAFTEQITGRAPEHRGNGLKFIIRSLNKLPVVSFLFQTGNAILDFIPPIDAKALNDYIRDIEQYEIAVFAKMVFRKL